MPHVSWQAVHTGRSLLPHTTQQACTVQGCHTSPLTPLPRCEVALIQNEVTNIFADDFAALADDEGAGLAVSHKETTLTETQSFTHLTYSKNKARSENW
jgi:hypothetical protein